MILISHLLKPVISQHEGSTMDVIQNIGENYGSFRKRIRPADQYKLRLSYLEYVIHKLGFRLRIEVIDDAGNIISQCESDPNRPMITNEAMQDVKERHFYAAVNARAKANIARKKSTETRQKQAKERELARARMLVAEADRNDSEE